MPAPPASEEAGAPGLVALLGSGETAAAGRRVLGRVFARLPAPRTVAVLDTPAGFQPNHRGVAEKVAHFIAGNLAEHQPRVSVVETRRAALGTSEGDAALRAIAVARCLVAGPGSPTYMLRELRETPYLKALCRAYAAGAALYCASAAVLAMGTYTIPVYEIFKAGEPAAWWEGLDLFGPYGLRLALVPHWDNREGGAEVDTSRCFLGEARFAALYEQLPADVVVLGIDEHTGCILDLAAGTVEVMGSGGAHVLREGRIETFAAGAAFPLDLLRASSDGATQWVAAAAPSFPLGDTAMSDVGEEQEGAAAADGGVASGFGDLVEALLAVRADLRAARQWAFADRIRDALAGAGVVVEDTPEGPRWHAEPTP
jgi:cyanophycinase-like exopeptidase